MGKARSLIQRTESGAAAGGRRHGSRSHPAGRLHLRQPSHDDEDGNTHADNHAKEDHAAPPLLPERVFLNPGISNQGAERGRRARQPGLSPRTGWFHNRIGGNWSSTGAHDRGNRGGLWLIGRDAPAYRMRYAGTRAGYSFWSGTCNPSSLLYSRPMATGPGCMVLSAPDTDCTSMLTLPRLQRGVPGASGGGPGIVTTPRQTKRETPLP